MSTDRKIFKRSYWIAPLLIAGLALGGTAIAVAVDNGSPPEELPAIAEGESGTPASYVPHAAVKAEPLDAVVAGSRVAEALKAGGINDVRVTSDGTRVSVAIEMDEFDDTVSQVWFADLAYGAAVELVTGGGSRSTFETVKSATVDGTSKDGSPTHIDLGVGAVALGQRFNSPADDDSITTAMGQAAAKYNLKVSSVDVFRPLEAAVRVVLVVPESLKPDWTIDELRSALVGQVPTVEGVLVELVTESGEPLLTSGVAYRSGGGGLWFAKGQDTRFGAVHGSLPAGE